MKEKVILDVDPGVDDALAIWYALESDKLDVIGITTCFGNVDVDTATRNALTIVDVAGSDVPVYRGAEEPLLREWGGPVPWIHGENGLGSAHMNHPARGWEQDDAVAFIRNAILSHPGEITLIPVARMTNVAKAFLFDRSLAKLVKRIVIMGGAAFCPGNVTPVAEANVWGDPEAAKILFESGAPITMVGLDVTMKTRLTAAHLHTLDMNKPYATLLKEAVSFYMHAYDSTQGTEGGWCPLHDPLAVGVVEDATLCTTRDYHVDVETRGEVTAGMTVVDARAFAPESSNVSVCVEVDENRFVQRFCDLLGMKHTVV